MWWFLLFNQVCKYFERENVEKVRVELIRNGDRCSSANTPVTIDIEMRCLFDLSDQTYTKHRQSRSLISGNSLLPGGGWWYPPMRPSWFRSKWVACSACAVMPGPPMRPSPFRSKPIFSSNCRLMKSRRDDRRRAKTRLRNTYSSCLLLKAAETKKWSRERIYHQRSSRISADRNVLETKANKWEILGSEVFPNQRVDPSKLESKRR